MTVKEGHPLKRLISLMCVLCLGYFSGSLTGCSESSDKAGQSSRARSAAKPGGKNIGSRQLLRAKLKRARVQVEEVAGAATIYAMEKGFPTSLEALVKTKHLTAAKIIDPWQRPIKYKRLKTSGFQVCSAGPDRKPGSKDDICRTDRP
jgi:hypothetical protein